MCIRLIIYRSSLLTFYVVQNHLFLYDGMAGNLYLILVILLSKTQIKVHKICCKNYRVFQITNLFHNSFILQQYVCYTTILEQHASRNMLRIVM